MIFWICLIVASASLIGCVVADKHAKYEVAFTCEIISIITYLITGFMLFAIIGNALTASTNVASAEQRYEILNYQVENKMYDTDIAKKALMVDIEDYNNTLIKRQTVQNDKWIGIFIPNVWDEFELIDYNSMK